MIIERSIKEMLILSNMQSYLWGLFFDDKFLAVVVNYAIVSFRRCAVAPIIDGKLSDAHTFGIGYSPVAVVLHHESVILRSEKIPLRLPLFSCLHVFWTVYHKERSPQGS